MECLDEAKYLEENFEGGDEVDEDDDFALDAADDDGDGDESFQRVFATFRIKPDSLAP